MIKIDKTTFWNEPCEELLIDNLEGYEEIKIQEYIASFGNMLNIEYIGYSIQIQVDLEEKMEIHGKSCYNKKCEFNDFNNAQNCKAPYDYPEKDCDDFDYEKSYK